MSSMSSNNLAPRGADPRSTNLGLECTIDALTRLYKLFVKLPYIPSECLMIAPENGWTTIDEDELRRRGKTDQAIGIIRHLPYLKQKGNKAPWTLAYNTLHINYAEGEMYQAWVESDLLKVPSHLLQLAQSADRYGIYWFLDTETYNVIEYSIMGETEEVSYQMSQATPPELKWTIQTRMPANEYFDLWRHKYETLEYFIVPDDQQFQGTAESFQKMVFNLWEESLWPSEDDEDDEDFEEVEDEVDSENVLDDEDSDQDLDEEDLDWEMVEDTNELDWLEKDKNEKPFPPFGQFDSSVRQEPAVFPLKGCRRSTLFSTGAPGQEIRQPPPGFSSGEGQEKLREEVAALFGIFLRHGWPRPPLSTSISTFRSFPVWGRELNVSTFDRENCYLDLVAFMRERQLKAKEQHKKRVEDQRASHIQRVTFIRHKLQKIFLHQEAVPAEDDILEASALIEELGCLFLEGRHVRESGITKVLEAILQSDSIPMDLRSKLQMILQ